MAAAGTLKSWGLHQASGDFLLARVGGRPSAKVTCVIDENYALCESIPWSEKIPKHLHILFYKKQVSSREASSVVG